MTLLFIPLLPLLLCTLGVGAVVVASITIAVIRNKVKEIHPNADRFMVFKEQLKNAKKVKVGIYEGNRYAGTIQMEAEKIDGDIKYDQFYTV